MSKSNDPLIALGFTLILLVAGGFLIIWLAQFTPPDDNPEVRTRRLILGESCSWLETSQASAERMEVMRKQDIDVSKFQPYFQKLEAIHKKFCVPRP